MLQSARPRSTPSPFLVRGLLFQTERQCSNSGLSGLKGSVFRALETLLGSSLVKDCSGDIRVL